MKIRVICIGKTKESYLKEGIDEFIKRISPFAPISFLEIKPENNRNSAEKIKKHAPGYKILLEVNGQEFSSEQLAAIIRERMNLGCSEIDFLIGGCTGFPIVEEMRIDLRLSLSRCTFTHQMIRLLLLEQIYRAFTIIKGHPYHK